MTIRIPEKLERLVTPMSVQPGEVVVRRGLDVGRDTLSKRVGQ